MLLQYLSTLEASCLRNLRSILFPQYKILNPNKEHGGIKKLRLNFEDICEFHDSIFVVCRMADRLIKHIENIHDANRNDDFRLSSLPTLERFSKIISEERKSAIKHHTGEYEFAKVCEFFYLTLYFIFENERTILLDFFAFSKKSILPLHKSLKTDIFIGKFSRIWHILKESFFFRRINAKDRHDSCLFFLSRFLESQNKIVSIEEIDTKYPSNDDLFRFCVNCHLVYYSFHDKDVINFQKIFEAEKYHISDLFSHYIYINGKMNRIAYHIRLRIKKFLQNNNLYLEEQFIEEGKIPPSLDLLNEEILWLGVNLIDS